MSTTVSPPASTGTRSHSALWWILVVVLLADALDMIDSTVTNIAAPTIVNEIGGGEALIKWLGAAYALALGVLLVVGGRLGDKYGQRRLFLIGMAGFTVASAVCGLATDPAMLVAARAVQGGFGALLIPQGMAIMTKTFPRDMLRKAFNVFGPLLGIASIGGPILAGFIINADIAGLTWRPIFLINITLGVVGMIAALIVLPKIPADKAVTVDGAGAGLLAVAMFGLMVGLIDGSTNGWTPLPIGSVAVGLVFFGLFAQRQRTAKDPLLKASLFKNHGFVFGLIVGLVFFAISSGLSYVLSLFMQQTLHATPMGASLGLLPLTIGIIASAGACMALMEKLGRKLIFIGLALTFVGAGWILALVVLNGTALTLWALAPAIFVVGLGMGACYGTIFDTALGNVSADEAGSASGSLTAIQQIANGIGSATVTSLYFHAASPGSPAAMTITLTVIVALTVACLPLVFLLPKKAQAQGH
jgi:EmrB/QacA subfamily drug resistance transporter